MRSPHHQTGKEISWGNLLAGDEEESAGLRGSERRQLDPLRIKPRVKTFEAAFWMDLQQFGANR